MTSSYFERKQHAISNEKEASIRHTLRSIRHSLPSIVNAPVKTIVHKTKLNSVSNAITHAIKTKAQNMMSTVNVKRKNSKFIHKHSKINTEKHSGKDKNNYLRWIIICVSFTVVIILISTTIFFFTCGKR